MCLTMIVRGIAPCNHMSDEIRTAVGARLRTERERLGLTLDAFAALGGASKRSLIDWEKGALVPNAEVLAKVAQHGVDVLYVLTGQRAMAVLTTEETALLDNYHHATPDGQRAARTVLVTLAQQQTYEQQPGGAKKKSA